MNIKLQIEGITPLLCNRFTDEAQMSASNSTRISTIGDKGSPRAQAVQKLYIGHDNKPIIPGPNMFRCLIEAGKFFKAGKSKVTTQKSSMLPACVSILDIEIPVQSKESWDVDTRAVRIPSTGGRILAHRPCFNDWRLAFEIELDTDLMSAKLLREIVDAAGKRIGLGDYRPDCKGPFGKFVVSHWEDRADEISEVA